MGQQKSIEGDGGRGDGGRGDGGAPPARRRGRPSHRAEIVEAAAQLFAKGGSRGTSLAAIAESIGVTAPAITHHFGSKEALLHEVVQSTDRLHEAVLEGTTTATALERLSATRRWPRLLEVDAALANRSRLSTIMTAEAIDPGSPLHDEFVKRHRRFTEEVVQLLESGRTDGSIRLDVDVPAMAAEIIAFTQGAQLRWTLDPDSIDLVGAYDRFFDRLVAELSAARPPGGDARVADRRGRPRRG